MSNTESIGFFTPMRFSEGKQSQEKMHWLGRLVESYFDLGQQGVVVLPDESPDGIAFQHDKRKLSPGAVALKVLTVALKVVSYIILPLSLIMLIGKAIYRHNNQFVYQEQVASQEHQRFSMKLIDSYTSKKQGNSYQFLKEGVEYVTHVPDDRAHPVAVMRVVTGVDNALKEVGDAMKRSKRHLTENLIQNLDSVKNDLQELRLQLTTKFNDQNFKSQLVKALEEATPHIQDELNRTKESQNVFTDLWEEKKEGEKIGSEEFFQSLLKGIGDYSLPNVDELLLFSEVFHVLKNTIPGIVFSEEAEQLLRGIDQIFLPNGIRNLGNSCYLNSIIQALFASPEIYKIVDREIREEELERRAEENDDDFELRVQRYNEQYAAAEKLRKTLLLLFHAQCQGNKEALVFLTSKLREWLFDNKIINELRDQQDAQEVMQAILDRLKVEMITIESVKKYQNLEAERENRSVESSLFLMLDVKDQNGPVSFSLQGLLDNYFQPKIVTDNDGWRIKEENVVEETEEEIVVNQWEESVKLVNAPRVIFIQLKRYQIEDGQLSKIGHHVEMPAGGIVCLKDCFKERGIDAPKEEVWYQVEAVVPQSGSLYGGHYTANVKKGMDWYHCDDSSVSKAKGSVSENAYFLVLQKIEI